MSLFRYLIEMAAYSFIYAALSSHYTKFTTLLFLFVYIYQLVYIFRRSKYNGVAEYFSFNYMFFIMLTLITYLVPIFYLLGLDDLIRYISPASYETEYIPKSLYITSMAVASYTFGFTRRNENIETPQDNAILCNINNYLHTAKILTVLAFAFFIYQFMTAYESGMMDVEGFVVTIASVILIYAMSIAGYSNLLYKYNLIQFLSNNKLIFGLSSAVVILMMSIGDRFFPLLIICSMAFIINHFVYNISLKKFVVLVFAGAVLMFFISFTRFNDNKSIEGAISKYEYIANPAIVFQDIIPVNLDYYLALHYVDHRGYFIPGRIFVFLLKPIPFLPSYLTTEYFDGNITTGDLMTTYNASLIDIGSSTQGLGTHCIADVYMSWGIIGVCLLFMLFGYIIGKTYSNSNKIYSLLTYTALVAGDIYIPRESIFSTYRIAIWIIIMAYLLRSLSSKKLS